MYDNVPSHIESHEAWEGPEDSYEQEYLDWVLEMKEELSTLSAEI